MLRESSRESETPPRRSGAVRLLNTVRDHRTRAGVTQQELADACGVTRQTVIAVEKGRFNPSVALALQMARYLGVSVHDLFALPNEETEQK